MPSFKSAAAGLIFGSSLPLAASSSDSLHRTRFDDNLRQLMLGVGWGVRPDRDGR